MRSPLHYALTVMSHDYRWRGKSKRRFPDRVEHCSPNTDNYKKLEVSHEHEIASVGAPVYTPTVCPSFCHSFYTSCTAVWLNCLLSSLSLESPTDGVGFSPTHLILLPSLT
jgi:hypothetical protein